METTELFDPQIAVRAGAYRFDRGVGGGGVLLQELLF